MSDARESGTDLDFFGGKNPLMNTLFSMDIEPDEPDDETVAVMNMRSMIIHYVGKSTGRTYIFNGAGSVVEDVNKIDADEMINLHITPSCCGSYSTPYFQLVGR